MIPSEQINTGYLDEPETDANALEPFPWTFMMEPNKEEATPVERHEMMTPSEEDTQGVQRQRLNEWHMQNRNPEFKMAKALDELHVGLDIPKQAAIEVYNWVQEQDWPKGTELEPLEEYHITMLFAQGDGAGNHHDADWIKHDSHAVTVKGLKEFPPSKERDGLHPIVMLVDSDTIHEHHNALAEAAEEAGIDPGPHAKDKYAPHMTIGYGPGLPKGLKPPKLTFETEKSSVSSPRPEEPPSKDVEEDGKNYQDDQKQAHTWSIARVRPPYEAELLKFAASWEDNEEDEPVWGDEGLAMGRPVQGPLYHFAPTEDRARIQTHGLMAARPGINPRYDNLKGNGMPRFDTQPNGVYVTKEIQGTKIGLESPSDVWEVNPQHVRKLLTDPHAPTYWGVIPHDVPPEALTLHNSTDEDLWRMHGVDPLDPLLMLHDGDEKRYIKQILPLPREWQIGQPTAKVADSWSPKDQWPNALRERAFEPTDVDCTCKDGHKLDCPCHGLHPVLPTYDDTLEFPDPSSPVGYDYHTDAPRTWMRAETKVASHQLAWLPGSGIPGKGLVTPDGSVHTWPVDAQGAPHHAEYMDNRAPYQLGEGSAHFFNIRPRGGLDTKAHPVPANIINHIFQTVPSLRAGEHTDWHFATMKGHDWDTEGKDPASFPGRPGDPYDDDIGGFGKGMVDNYGRESEWHIGPDWAPEHMAMEGKGIYPHKSWLIWPNGDREMGFDADDESDKWDFESKTAADEWDSREYADSRMMPPTTMQEPAQGNPHPEGMQGCTCPEGLKLQCPVHGLNPDPIQQQYDHSWSIPQNTPVNFPQDQPRNYIKAEGSTKRESDVRTRDIYGIDLQSAPPKSPIDSSQANKVLSNLSDQASYPQDALPYPQQNKQNSPSEDQWLSLARRNDGNPCHSDFDIGASYSSTLPLEDDSQEDVSSNLDCDIHTISYYPKPERYEEGYVDSHNHIHTDNNDCLGDQFLVAPELSTSRKLDQQVKYDSSTPAYHAIVADQSVWRFAPHNYMKAEGAYQQNGEHSVTCDCPNCLQRREHSWHIQSPGTSSEGWGGLPRAEGTTA